MPAQLNRFALLFSVALLAQVSRATAIRVPQGAATIQAGVDDAVNGDTVLIADGACTGDGITDC